MLYVIIDHTGKATQVVKDSEFPPGSTWAKVETRNDWASYGRACEVAGQLTQALGEIFIATDAGAGCYPRYDVIRLPKIGAAVSKEFNGDAYTVGTIASISPTYKKITTTTGASFYRRGLTGSWICRGTWALQEGHYEKRNPSF